MNKKKKKKSKRAAVPPIPELPLDVLDEVQKVEGYAHREVLGCHSSTHFNTQKATRILRTCAVEVQKIQLTHYESLPNFDEGWVKPLQEDSIESAVGMIPGGYSDGVYERMRDLLWKTTYEYLNPVTPKKQASKKDETPKLERAFADQIRNLRDECRLTTEELAEAVGLDSRTVQRHIAGETQPYARHLGAYERVFSKSLERKIVIKKMP